jgi:hypothetical protein
MLVLVGHIGAYEVGLCIEDLARTVGVVGVYRLGELADGEGVSHRTNLQIGRIKRL